MSVKHLGFAAVLCACSSVSILPETTSVEAVLRATRAVGEQLDVEERERYLSEGREPASKFQPSFQQPTRHFKVSSSFGKRAGGFHSGIDVEAREGTPIYAAEKGIVVFSGRNIAGYGDTIIIRHVGDTATLYAHASYLGVKQGDVVEKGQFIAYAGESGNATGPHLHFEIREGSQAVNPKERIRGQSRTRSKAR